MTSTLTNARWTIHGANELLPFMLLLEADGLTESTGVSSAHLRNAGRHLDHEFFTRLTTVGVDLDETELAVHARLWPLLGHGAFASAHIRLMPPQSQALPRQGPRPFSPNLIAAGDLCVGVVQDGTVGPPYIAVAEAGDLTDCLMLTWSGDWMAFRTWIRTDFLLAGEIHLRDALTSHKRRVADILGPPGVLAALRSGACVN